MKQYEAPTIETIIFDSLDIVTTSSKEGDTRFLDLTETSETP